MRLNPREVEDALMYMALCEKGPRSPGIEWFDGALIGTYGSLYEMIHVASGGSADGLSPSECWGLASKQRSVRGGMVMQPPENARHEAWRISFASELGYVAKQKLSGIYRVPMVTDARGETVKAKLSPIGHRVIETRECALTKEGEIVSVAKNYFVNTRSSVWHSLIPETRLDELRANEKFTSDTTTFMFGVLASECRKSMWSATIRMHPDYPGIGLLTDPTGIKEIFKSREIPPGKTRRDALAHWVSRHWRQTRHDPDVEVYVREHLRGRTEFSWFGMGVKIGVPPSDSDRLSAAAAERERLRASGRDRRARVILSGL